MCKITISLYHIYFYRRGQLHMYLDKYDQQPPLLPMNRSLLLTSDLPRAIYIIYQTR